MARLRRRLARGRSPDDRDLLAASSLFDHEWYAGQAGRAFTRDEAVAHYLGEGSAAGLTPHPLVDPTTIRLARPGRVGDGEPLVAYLRHRMFHAPTHPLFDTFTYVRAHPESLEHPDGPVGHYVGVGAAAGLAPNDWFAADPAASADLVAWVVSRRGFRPDPVPAADWPELEGRARQTDLTTVVVVAEDGRHVPDAVRRLREAGDGPVEVVVVDAGTDPVGAVCLAAVTRVLPAARLGAVPPGTSRADAVAAGIAQAHGGIVVLLREGAEVLPGWLGPLREALDDDDVLAAQPLLLDPAGTIRSAGLTSEGDRRRHLLAGFPAEDALSVGPEDVQALGSGALAVRTSDLVALRGLPDRAEPDAVSAELCRRLQGLRPGRVVVRMDARVVLGSIATPVPLRGEAEQGQRPGARVVERTPQLRWAIKNPAPRLDTADLWGDTHFARLLADALERLGQQVVVDIRPAFHRPTRVHDDVTLTLRGRAAYDPTPGETSLLWVISHPELVDRDEAARFDRVLAAGTAWAGEVSRRWGIRVDPLLQATDPAAFHPDLAGPDTGHRVLFVGSSRKQLRPLVRDAVAAGLPLSVFGRQWEGLIPAEYVKGEYLPNAELGAAYRSAGVVLNDHWEDMRTEGFLSNRLFDAVAAGARVVTDDVAGLRDVFGETVQVARDAEDMRRLAGATDLDAVFGSDEVRREWASRIHREHSFDARARTLIDLVLEIRAHRR